MYSFTQRAHQLESLKRFLNASNPLMLVIGQEGLGKTSLINQLIADIQVKQRVICLQGEENLQPAQLTLLLSRHWDININSYSERYRDQLDKIVLELAAHNQACALIVDDAECLPLATLAALAHLAIKQDTPHIHLHVLLLGKPTLLEKAGTLQSNAIPYLQLNPLSLQETHHYIKYCLSFMSDEKRPPPSHDIVNKIHAESKGVPAAIQQMTAAWLKQQVQSATLQKIQQPLPNSTATRIKPAHAILWRQHWVKSVSLVVLLLIGFVMWHHKQHPRFFFIHAPSPVKHNQAIPITMTTDAHFVSAATQKQQAAYILQLMGSRDLNALARFVANHKLQHHVHIMTAAYQGKAWYILAYGKYSSVASAKTARQQLPPLLKKLQPWIRPVASIH